MPEEQMDEREESRIATQPKSYKRTEALDAEDDAPPIPLGTQRRRVKVRSRPGAHVMESGRKPEASGIPSWVGFAAGAALIALIAVLAVIFSRAPASTANDELITLDTQAADYSTWKTSLAKLTQPAAAASTQNLAADPIGFWDKWMKLPPEKAALAALQRRIPLGVRMTRFEPVGFQPLADGVEVTYATGIKINSNQFLVPVRPFIPANNSSATYKKLSPLLILAPDLPPGQMYDTNKKAQVALAGEEKQFNWTVRRAAKSDGKWRVLSADPIVYQRNPAFESRMISEGGDAQLLRSEMEIAGYAGQANQVIANFETRLADIESQIAAFKEDAMSDTPAKTYDRGSGSGTGVPTKTAIGVIGGAGTGAAIGGAAGGGDGAAIGAGAGGLLGGIIGYNVGRSDEKRRVQQQNAARRAAINAANARVSNYSAQLYADFEQELRTKATAHQTQLAGQNRSL